MLGIPRLTTLWAVFNVTGRMDDPRLPERYAPLLRLLDSPDGTLRERARGDLVALVEGHMRTMAHRMLRGFAGVRRWDETDDIVQGAALRLHRALADVVPCSPAGFMGLVAVQVRRELLDLARRYSGPESFANHHDTNVATFDGESTQRTDLAAAPVAGTDLERWTMFHELAAALPDDDREVFQLVWYVGASQTEIATLLGCSERTVRRRWDSAKHRLKTAFDGPHAGGES